MKKLLLSLCLACPALVCIHADLIWYEGFNYPDGSTTNNSGGLWGLHSGNPDSVVAGGLLQVGSAAYGLSGDIHRDFCLGPCDYTNAPTVVYASFTVNSTNFPDTDGGHFAHFYSNSFSFQGRVFAVRQPESLPNTWQLGVSGAAGTASAVFPADLATNVDYQVVIEWDPVNLFATTLWVNPISADDPKVISSDPVAAPLTVNAFAFRQASGFGDWYCTISNLAVATTFAEAATNVWPTAAVSPIIAYQPESKSNFVGDVVVLSAVAAGQGLGGMAYDWYKNGAPFANPNGNSNALTFFSAVEADSGNYRMVATTPHGLSVTSAIASLWVTNPPVPPNIIQQPTNTTVFFGQTASLRVTASGVQPISHQWFFANGTPVSGPNFSGETTDTLTITDVRTDNGTTGGYYCELTNPFGTSRSATATVSAISAPVVTIGYLRTLVDPVFFLPTNTTALWTVTGIVTTHTNITTSGNCSFYMQDDTGGINVFYGGNSTARPAAGDMVTVTGPLGQFNSLLELNLTVNDPAHGLVTNSSGHLLPPGQVLPLSFTNGIGFGGVGESIRKFQGLVVTLTNVYFVNAGESFVGNRNYVITNQAGETFAFRVDARVGDIIGQPIPAFAWTVTGPMAFFLNTGNANRSAGYQILPTRYVDIATAAPPTASGTGSLVANQPRLTWLAQPYMSYSILAAASVAGPYVPLITGLTFNTEAGQFTDTNAAPATRFYRIISP